MPLSTALPAPSLSFYGDFQYPINILNQFILDGIAAGDTFSKTKPDSVEGSSSCSPEEAVGSGGTVGPFTQQVGGRRCARITTTVGGAGSAFAPTCWQPAWDAASWANGALLDPSSVVGIFDVNLCMTQAAFVAASGDQTGVYFRPNIGLGGGWITGVPPGVGTIGGFGIFANDDGGGTNQFEFVSWTAGAYPGNVVLRIPIPVAVVPDTTIWSTFRFTIIGAGPGRAPSLSLAVNSTPIAGLTGRAFDDVTLFLPQTLSVSATRLWFGHALGAMGGQGINFWYYARFGRYTATGEEVQGIV